jgi:hypothetical protein
MLSAVLFSFYFVVITMMVCIPFSYFVSSENWSLWNAGFNVETVEYKNISFTVWDVGGQDKVWFSINFIFCIMMCCPFLFRQNQHSLYFVKPLYLYFGLSHWSALSYCTSGLCRNMYTFNHTLDWPMLIFVLTDQTSLEALLPEHTGSYLCCGQQWSWSCCWSQRWAPQDAQWGKWYPLVILSYFLHAVVGQCH